MPCSPMSLTRLTVLTVLTMLWDRFSPMAVILIVRVPNRPSRPKTISIPSVRSGVCARRSRPASARGFFGQPERFPTMGLPATLAPASRRSEALPAHCARSAIISRTRAATGSASTMFSIASRRRSQPCAPTTRGAPAAASVSHARPHRGARQECAVGRARTPAIAQSPAGVAVRQSVRASAGLRGPQDRDA